MSTAPTPPTGEQLDAARAFVITRQRRNRAELGTCGPEVVAAFDAWSHVVDKHMARAKVAVDRGEPVGAAGAWAVVVEALAGWVTHPEFPPCLYAEARAARYGS
ncbi:hypothetical protein [Kitasatospora sp. NPDC093679]|uniref:hypothetical protein n=1 Tax=Kitasatospora sp. NPDC093679 TaxID=3154983 RepID=UPI00342EB0F7